MGTQPDAPPKIAFGPFEFDAPSGDLRKFGNRIRLQGKPVQILSILIAQPGRIVSREELQRHLWHDTTFVDFEQGLNAAVNKLRQALNDSADQPRYVETVPGRGYRFIGPIQRAPTRTVLEMAAPPAKVEPKRPWGWWAAGAAGLIAIGAGGYWFGAQRNAPIGKRVEFTIAPPAGYALEAGASRQSFALSPDGTRLAFTAMNTSGAFQAFIRTFDSVDTRPILTPGAHTLFWAPDGKSIFIAARGKLLRAPLDRPGHDVVGDSPGFLLSGTWRGQDELLLGSVRETSTIPSTGGSLRSVQVPYRWAQMLPDGEHLLYIGWDSATRHHQARVVRYGATDPPRDLVETDSRVLYTASLAKPSQGYLIFIRSGNLMAQPFDPSSLSITGQPATIASNVYSFFPTGAADFSVSSAGVLAYSRFAGRSQLAWVDRQGRQLSTIGPADVNLKSGRLSPDGRTLVTAIYDVENGVQDLWRFDTATGEGRRMLSAAEVRDAPVWSPDSRQLAYLHAYPERWPKISIHAFDHADTEKDLVSGGFQMPTDWSPDGRFIAFANTGQPRIASETQGDVWLVDLARGRKMIPLLNTKFHEANAMFSPDGKWLAFLSNESGKSEVYVQAFEAGDSPRVTGERLLASTAKAGAQALRWRRDGRELFYLGFDGRVRAVPVTLGARPKFGPTTGLFTISTDARAAVHAFLGFDVSADGQRFVIPVVNSAMEGPSVVVVQNWEAGLPR